MKKLGLIGGIGPESTIPYYRGIMYGVQSRVAVKRQILANSNVKLFL